MPSKTSPATPPPTSDLPSTKCKARTYLKWPFSRFVPRPFERLYPEKTWLASGERGMNRAPFASTAACSTWRSPLRSSPVPSREKCLRGRHLESNKSSLVARAADFQAEPPGVWSGRQLARGMQRDHPPGRTPLSPVLRKLDDPHGLRQ